uniref:protein zwilch homolog isoform X2 n=1 Tax=Myxine glutinosa TaxID=7769 RepID=UPI00358E2E7C
MLECLEFYKVLSKLAEDDQEDQRAIYKNLAVKCSPAASIHPLGFVLPKDGRFLLVEGCPTNVSQFKGDSQNAEDSREDEDSCEHVEPGPLPEDWTDASFIANEKESFTSLPVQDARRLLSWFCIGHNNHIWDSSSNPPSLPLPPLWVRCDMKDKESICWMGACPMVHSSSIEMQLYTATCKGPLVGTSALPSLDEVILKHKARHRVNKVRTTGYTRYVLFGPPQGNTSLFERCSNINVEFWWSDVNHLFQVPPTDATATLRIRVEPGDVRSPVHAAYKELDFLARVICGLQTGEMDWCLGDETQTAATLVETLINELKSCQNPLQGYAKKESEIVETPAMEAEVVMQSNAIPEREDLDFCEQLWFKMKSAVFSYTSIQDCLNLVLQALANQEIQPWTHRDNSSLLSEMVQQSCTGAMKYVPLVGKAPLEMLAQIGLDKIHRDYLTYFLGQELTTLKYLEYFFGMHSSLGLQEQLCRLTRLEHIFEVVAICRTFLSIPHENLFLLTMQMLQFYHDRPVDPSHVFSLSKPSVDKSLYEKRRWRNYPY